MRRMSATGWVWVTFGLMGLWALPAGAAETALYVAADGNDGWTGRLAEPNAARTDGPFATLVRARDEVRRLKAGGRAKGPMTIFVRGGLYPLQETLTLEAQDSGTAEAPVTYRAYRAGASRGLSGAMNGAPTRSGAMNRAPTNGATES
ncbi:MAG: hypothetical protein FJ291_33140, partial [Planctomycetes bacterium]|nr:hypothetical protein [Planctomycetota bacterium]